MNTKLIHTILNSHTPTCHSLPWLPVLLWNLWFAPLPVFAATSCGTQVDIPAIECNALLDFYNSTSGPSWTDSPGNGWNQNDNPCTWAGVTCNLGKVTQLFRSSQNLNGSLPGSLNNLIFLTNLDLSNNRLTGNVPPLPSSLTFLNLSGNAFTGYLPSFAGLTGLVPPNLNIEYNLFMGPYAGETALVASKQSNWQNTQTVPPLGVNVTPLSLTEVRVNWTPISYTADGGYYQVKYSTAPGGPYTPATSTTPDKNASSYVVTGLSPNTTYYFLVETFTPAHPPQPNNLTSVSSPLGTATTPSCTALSVTNTADSGPGSLRQALADVCDGGTITMGVSGSTITLSSSVTFTANNVTFNANTQNFAVTGGDFVAPGKNLTIDRAANLSVAGVSLSTTNGIPGGRLTLSASGNIIASGHLLTYSSNSTGNSGLGGNITMNSGGGSIIVGGSVRTYSQSVSGTEGNGGNVTVTAGTSLKVHGTDGNGHSINADGANGGIITITTGASPFIVGNASANGTYAGITRGATSIPITTAIPPNVLPSGIAINGFTCPSSLTVTDTADSGPGSLRDAIAQVCVGGMITVSTSPIDLTSGELVIDKKLTITTPVDVNQTIQRNTAASPFRIFNIRNATVTLNNLTLTNGSNANEGGGIYVASNAVLNLYKSHLSGNTAGMYGGGIYSLGQVSVSNSTFSDNTVPSGGGGGAIFNANSLTIHDSTFSANSATSSGGAIFSNNGSLDIVSSTFVNNSASNYGGAIRNDAGITVTNSTFSGNTAYGGGGINNYGGTLTVNNSTFSGNSANLMGGAGIYNQTGATLKLTNTLIANSTSGGDCANLGTLAINTNNLIEDGSCSPALTGDPLLGPLQDYGTTSTFALLAGSPAIDAGDNASCAATDQGGNRRPLDWNCDGSALCDIGAFERSPVSPDGFTCIPPPTDTIPTDTTTIPLTDPTTGTCQANITVTRTEDDSDVGSLRNAIAQTCPGGLIDFAETITTPIYLNNHLLITQNLTITGGTNRHIAISGDSNQDGSGEVPVFEISNGIVVFNHLIITHGTGDRGAGIHVTPEAMLTLDNCQLRNNQAPALYSTDKGGGLFNEGTVNIYNSTFYKNRAWEGGGIYNAGTLFIVNSTIAEGTSDNQGGGIYNTGGLDIYNSTLAWNTATGDHGGGGIYNVGTLQLFNTLIAHSTQGGDCYNGGILSNNSHNFIADGTCDPMLMGDPLLGESQILDETTPFLTLLANSPAVEAGEDTHCPETDQRGLARPFDGNYDGVAGCDIGAYEYGATCQNTVIVTTTAETGPESLREAVSKVCRDGTIKLQVGGIFTLTSDLEIAKNVTLDGTGQTFSITSYPIVTHGNNLRIEGAEITLETVDTSTTTDHFGGSLTITALTGNLTVTTINTSSHTVSENAGKGGDVTLTAPLGSIQVSGEMTTYSRSEQVNANGAGNVTITAGNGIEIGSVNASTFAPQGSAGEGGVIVLRTTQGDLVVHGYLHSGTSNGVSNAGNLDLQAPAGKIIIDSYILGGTNATLDINAGHTFQAQGEIPETVGNTIYTGGSITIHHGGQGLVPFTVGSASDNGTTYGITSLATTVPPGQYFENYTLGIIQILTESQPVPQPTPQFVSNPPPYNILNFGESLVGTPVSARIDLIQQGSVNVLLESPQLTGPNADVFSVLTAFPLTIMPEAEAQSILIQCLPTLASEQVATLQLTTNDPLNFSPTYELVCTGISAPELPPVEPEEPSLPTDISSSHILLDLGSSAVGVPVTLDWSLPGLNETELQITEVSLTGDNPDDFSLLTPLFPITIPPAETVTMTIQCLPTGPGIRMAHLDLSTTDPVMPTLNYLLLCKGEVMGPAYDSLPAPGETIRAVSSNLTGLEDLSGLTADSTDSTNLTGLEDLSGLTPLWLELSMMEIGMADLTIDLVGITGPHASDFTLLQPAFPVLIPNQGDPVLVKIQCTPTAPGLRLANLELSTNDPLHPTVTYPLYCFNAGEEGGPIYYSQPAPNNLLVMTQDEFGSPTTAEVAIWNIGSQPLDLLTSYLSEDFINAFHLIQGAAPVSLPVNSEKHTLVVQCGPILSSFASFTSSEAANVNTATATLTVTTNDPVQPVRSYGLICTYLIPTLPNGETSSDGSVPTDIMLSNATIPELSPAGTLIGKLTIVDPDATDSHSYTLVIDSGQFVIVGNELRLADGVSLDFETLSDYHIAVRSTDSKGLYVEKAFTIQVTDIDELSKLPMQLATGQFSGEIRADSGLVGDQVSVANPEHFILTGKIQPLPEHLNQLANVILIYQWQPEEGGMPLSGTVTIAKQVRLKEIKMTLFQGNLAGLAGVFNVSLGYQLVTPDSPLVYAPIAILTVQPNQRPTSLTLSATTVAENSPPDTVIGRFTSPDPDFQESFTYSLVDNLGYQLQIVGDELRTGGFPLDFESTPHPQITVRSFDAAGDFIEEQFTLTVTDVEPKPEAIRLTRQTVLENSSTGTVVGRLVTSSREGGTFRYELLEDAGGRFVLQGDLLVVANGEQLQQARHTITVQAQEVDSLATLTETLTIEVYRN